MIAPLNADIVGLEEKGDDLKIIYGQNVTPILEHNYELRKHTKQIWRSKKNNPIGEYVGWIPKVVLLDWLQKGLLHDSGCDCCTDQERRKTLFALLNLYPEYKTTTKTL